MVPTQSVLMLVPEQSDHLMAQSTASRSQGPQCREFAALHTLVRLLDCIHSSRDIAEFKWRIKTRLFRVAYERLAMQLTRASARFVSDATQNRFLVVQ